MARANASGLALDVGFHEADWHADAVLGAQADAALHRTHASDLPDVGAERASFDLIVSNPPYVDAGDPHLQALSHEPRQALVAGAGGMHDLLRIISISPARLRPGGWLLLEHGHDQSEAVQQALLQSGFSKLETREDLAGLARCSGGQWPGPQRRPGT